MNTYRIEYRTAPLSESESESQLMSEPMTIDMKAVDPEQAVVDFNRVFIACFGSSLYYKIDSIRYIGWHTSGEYQCPHCGTIFGCNLKGEKPFALVAQHKTKCPASD